MSASDDHSGIQTIEYDLHDVTADPNTEFIKSAIHLGQRVDRVITTAATGKLTK